MLRFHEIPLYVLLAFAASLLMIAPALHAYSLSDYLAARSFFYAGFLGLFISVLFAIIGETRSLQSDWGIKNLISIVLAYFTLPVFLAVPFYETLQTTSFVNAYFEMVSAFTTTGMPLFEADRLNDTLHLWRGLVGWYGGLFVWIMAAAFLAPLALGGFEVTATGQPGTEALFSNKKNTSNTRSLLERSVKSLMPIYLGLTIVLGVCLTASGEKPLVASIHAMATLSTSGISPLNGIHEAGSGLRGELLIALFMLFALSRLTFSTDTATSDRQGLLHDPEFRLGAIIILAVTALLFLRGFIASLGLGADVGVSDALNALWGSFFTVISFLTTTGFESIGWEASRSWSGLGMPGLILLGLALIGGGVATTAGGVKLLRVYALYLQGMRELERLIHPSSLGNSRKNNRRIRRDGAFIAWIFFMLLSLSAAFVTLSLAAQGVGLEAASILSVAALTTTGPLVSSASDTPIVISNLSELGKFTLIIAMIIGRLETLALIAVLNFSFWRD